MPTRRPSVLTKSIFGYRPRQPVAPDVGDAPAVAEPLPVDIVEAPAAGIEDESALVLLARTDPDAFGQLYERYVERVYSYIYYRVGNVQDAEDLTARTFYRALDKLDRYEDRGLPFSAWLFRIAHNLVANWHRDHGQRRFLSLDRLWWHSNTEDTPDEQIEQHEEQAALMDAISRLPEERRNLLHYKLNTPLSNLEIGELMDKSECHQVAVFPHPGGVTQGSGRAWLGRRGNPRGDS
ncbi:MAG: sigma-70 family RNA polymerase sigma factor [Anaerolineales bacterium]|nr:sigma-70 family RNA polymerase sigma factor [Anaerolineales bacterium]